MVATTRRPHESDKTASVLSTVQSIAFSVSLSFHRLLREELISMVFVSMTCRVLHNLIRLELFSNYGGEISRGLKGKLVTWVKVTFRLCDKRAFNTVFYMQLSVIFPSGSAKARVETLKKFVLSLLRYTIHTLPPPPPKAKCGVGVTIVYFVSPYRLRF